MSETRQAGNIQGIILILAAIMPVMAIISLVPVMPLLGREFGPVPGSKALVPILLTVPALCVAIFSGPAGWLSDRIGRKMLLFVALLGYAAIGIVPYFFDRFKTNHRGKGSARNIRSRHNDRRKRHDWRLF